MTGLSPGATIGILGGGQLGRMLAMAAAQLGFRSHIYCPDHKFPADQVTDLVTRAAYEDKDSLEAFAASVDVITYEFENIPVETVGWLAGKVPVFPDARVLEVSQDRLQEKGFINALGIATAPYAGAGTAEEALSALEKTGYPAVLKTRRFGYDGKGQAIVRSEGEVKAAFDSLGSDKIIVEGFVNFDMEISVLVARGRDGEVKSFLPAENIHTNHILDVSICPARIGQNLLDEAVALAEKIVAELNYVGVLAVELFVSPEEPRLRVNEIAPRVHNSGHWSIEACPTSQFEQHIRAICGLPLGDTRLYGQAVMKNLIGDDILDMKHLLADPDANVHHYGKLEARPGRKMGHVTRLYPLDVKIDI
ncbi:5-(carboxyamino)imidazole ribonucleotide synthase [Emcibacter sp.]|uniref:5-(carboxyamino)imidazole ribonucleotide synthase n=1 Tax=Emcibacter sp. TaxID=1979954 RepID=UPI002AA6DB9A|nr:5-(carboxyamino)imidazole ribonucleotide synthase [Emcibacter sp.]